MFDLGGQTAIRRPVIREGVAAPGALPTVRRVAKKDRAWQWALAAGLGGLGVWFIMREKGDEYDERERD